MTGQQLKNSILQLAIQGKLVAQDPTDEPASVLLQRIRKEKEQLVKEGKLKKKDLISEPIAENEKPFDIPESWEWCRLGEIAVVKSSKRVFEKDYVSKGIPFFRSKEIGDLSRKEEIHTELYITKEHFDYLKNSYGIPLAGDILITSVGTIGNTWICDGRDFYYKDGNITQICKNNNFEPSFIEICLHSPMFYDQIKSTVAGTAYNALTIVKLNGIKIPLPPLAEQQRIVAKIEELLPLVEDYDKAQKELNDLNEKLPEQLKKSILQQAIMGKLVPQDPADEPASILLQRIRKEKEQLVKEGKLKKKDLETTPIADDEKPFDIPESWEWCRLGEICTKIVDGDHNPPAGQNCKTPYLMLSSQNINFDSLVNLDNVRYLTENVFLKEDFRTEARIGDILFTSVGTLGRSCVLNVSLNLCFQRSVTVLRTNIFNQYLKRILDSPYIQDFVGANATGTAQRGFYINQMTKLVIPLPPLSEQHRIVAKIEELFAQLDKIEKGLN